jgi:alcohol dehydrogenase (cytochrome c)
MTIKKLLVTTPLVLLLPVLLTAQGKGLDPAQILKPLQDSWPTYSGDYSGKRYSALKQIDRTTVKNLSLAWTAQITPGIGSPGGFGGFGFGGPRVTVSVGGEGTGEFPSGGGGNIKASILEVDGTLYLSTPDNAWAMDARTGRELWHYFWKTKGGTHIGSRGMAMWHDYVYFETPDNYLVSLEAKTGKERWHKIISDFNQQYFSTMAPIVIGNHVLAGTGNDLDAPGFLQAFDPETGELQWKFYTVPMNQGDPGLDTWGSLDSARHGGAQVWIPGSFDPETNLYIFGTGNPTPAYTEGRGPGDNLFTCSLLAVNVDTGKMAWYYQTSPHDKHDWDSAQTPVLFDGQINGRPRKLVATAARNGYFFVLDRTTGERLVSGPFGSHVNWATGLDDKGRPKRDPAKDASIGGSLVSPNEGGVTNWEPPAFNPDTGLFYVAEENSYSIFYLLDPDPRGSMGLGGKLEAHIGSAGSYLTALDYKTGKAVWREPYPGLSGGGGGGGLLTTAGGLVFAGDAGGNVVAHDAKTGKPVWHSRIGNVTNAPGTYMLDGRQYLLVAAGDKLFAFALYQ